MRKKHVILALLCYPLLSTAIIHGYAAIQPDSVLTISAANRTFKLGDPIPVNFSFRNESWREIEVIYDNYDPDLCGITVTAEDGRVLEPIQSDIRVLSITSLFLKPGESHSDTVMLEKEIDLQVPGKYQVRFEIYPMNANVIPGMFLMVISPIDFLRYYFSDDPYYKTIKSNQIFLEITE